MERKKFIFISVSSSDNSVWSNLSVCNYGVLLLAQILSGAGYDVKIFDNASLDYVELASADYIGLSFFTAGSGFAFKVVREIKKVCEKMDKERPIIIMGGSYPTACPNECFTDGGADYIIRGPAEISLPRLLEELDDEQFCFSTVPGLSYCEKFKILHNKIAEFTNEEWQKFIEILPARHLDPTRGRWNAIPTLNPKRGCPYNCNFCMVNFPKKVVSASPEWVVAELEKIVYGGYLNWSRVVFICCDNFAEDPEWARKVLCLARQKGLHKKICLHIQARADMAQYADLLKLMEGFVTRVYIGIENLNPEALKAMNKGTTVEEMRNNLLIISKAGIPIHGHFILAGDFDFPVATVLENVMFAKALGFAGISLFCSTPFVGTKLHEKLEGQGRIIGEAVADYYNLNHLVIFPLLGRPSDFQNMIAEGYKSFYDRQHVWKRFKEGGIVSGFYALMMYRAFRKRDLEMEEYIRFLEEVEKDKYNRRGEFIG